MNIKNCEKFLKDSSIIQKVKILICDKEKVIFSYPEIEYMGESLSKEMENFINTIEQREVSLKQNVLNWERTKQIIENDNKQYTAQMVAPFDIDKKKKATIIFYRDYMKNVSPEFVESKIESIKITRMFVEKLINKEVV